MNHKFMKLAGIKDIDSFYKAFPTEEAFFKAHPEAHPSYAKGGTIPSKDVNTGAFLNTRLGEGNSGQIVPLPDGDPQPGPKPRKPIIVTNPNDPKLKAYNDSLNLHKAYQMQDKLMGPNNNYNKPVLPVSAWTPQALKEARRKKIVKGLESVGPIADDFQDEKDMFTDNSFVTPNDKKLIQYYKSLGFNDNNIMYHTSADIIHPKIKPIGTYFDGTAQSPVYKKPVQPVVYQPQPRGINAPIPAGKKYVEKRDPRTGDIYGALEDIPKPKPQEKKDYPIRGPLPKAQAKINITAPQQSMMPEPQGDYVYGPANSVIGTNVNGKFTPINMPEQRGTVNQADWDMLNNQESMKKYVQGKGLEYKSGGKLKGKKAAWGASLGTDPYIGGPDPIKLDLNGKPLTGVNTTPSAGLQNYQPITMPTPIGGTTGFPNTDSPAFTNYPTLGTTSLPPSNPYMSQAIPMDPKQTGYRGPQQGQGALNSGQVPITPEADKNAIPIKKEAKKLSMPDGAASGGFTGQGILAGLEIASALMPPDKIRRRYVRPEDMQSYNPNQYGTGSQAISEYGNTLKGKKKKAFWGALIGVAVDKAKEVKKGIHQNIENAVAPILNIANNNAAEAARLDNLYLSGGVQDVSKLQPVQPLIPQQPQYPQYMAHGGEMKYKNGGELLTGKEGKTELKSYNHFDGGTFQFNGPQHSEGGISIDYKGSPAEVEGGETAFKDKQGDLKIMGNLIVPGTNMKYKAMSKLLSKKEEKAQKYIDRGSLLLNTASPTDPYESLSFNSGKAMAIGGLQKQKQIAEMKEHLGNMQEAHLETINEKKATHKTFKDGGKLYAEDGAKAPGDPVLFVYKGKKYTREELQKVVGLSDDQFFAKLLSTKSGDPEGITRYETEYKKVSDGSVVSEYEINTYLPSLQRDMRKWIANGDYTPIPNNVPRYEASSDLTSINSDENPKPKKKWVYKDADVKNLDPTILAFADMLAAKGIEGYTGSRGGYRSGSKTTSGRKSRHARNQALDLIPVDGQAAYTKILNDPELVDYLMTNGLTVIDEYDPQTAKKTGATAGHLHIGRDKGTNVADEFRNDVMVNYPQYKKKLSSSNYKEPALNQGVGDAYTENTSTFINKPWNIPKMDYTPLPTNIQTVEGGAPIDIKPVKPWDKPSNARGISPLQFMGEAMALGEQVEPVPAQLYTPELYQPYQVSFQDRLNENQATFNNIQRQLAYDPTALSTLAAQEYSADSSVLADEFRTNQGIANDITNKNIALLNEAEKTNLQILDTQMVRQETAKSKTRENKQAALSSISSKMLQKEASNNALRVYENLYPDYAFNNKTGRAQYYGPDATSQIDWGGLSPINTADRTKIETKNGPVKTTQYYDDPTDQFMKSLNIQKKRNDLYTPKNLTYFLKNK